MKTKSNLPESVFVLNCKKEGIVKWKEYQICIIQNKMIISSIYKGVHNSSKEIETINLTQESEVSSSESLSSSFIDVDAYLVEKETSKYIKVRGMNTKNERVLWYIQCPSEDDFHHIFQTLQYAKRPVFHENTKCCELCSDPFSLWHRRHHCRRCGRCICCTCSNHFVVLDDMGYTTKERICRNCLQYTHAF